MLEDQCPQHKAEVQQPITLRTAFGGIAEVNNAQNHDSKGPLSALSGPSLQTIRVILVT